MLGRAGIRANKYEGDGATPRGRFRLRAPVVAGRPPSAAADPAAGAAHHARTSPGVKIPPTAATIGRSGARPLKPGDRLWRDDHLYDFVIEIDHNTRPRVAGRGSAVFMHVARPNRSPTAGCVALDGPDLRRLLAGLGPSTRIAIER